MNEIEAEGYFETSWRTAGRAVLEKPVLSVSVFAVTFCYALAKLQTATARAHAIAEGIKPSSGSLVSTVGLLCYFLAVSALSAHVMRSAIYGSSAESSLLLRSVWRYWRRLWAIGFIIAVLSFIVGLVLFILLRGGVFGSRTAAFDIVIAGVVSVVGVTVFLFPKICFVLCGAALATRVTFAEAWALSRGAYWQIFTAQFLIWLVVMGLTVLVNLSYIALHLVLSPVNMMLAHALGTAITGMISTAGMAACTALFYRKITFGR